MYSIPQLTIKYLQYYLKASNAKGHGIHSPFIFNFITEVLNDRKHYPEYKIVEDLRQRLRLDNTEIIVEDYGAGSITTSSNRRSIRSIARNAAKTAKFGQLMFRIARKYKPQTIIELGTSLGITSSYLALGNPGASVLTCEGAPGIAEVAMRNFKDLNLGNIELIQGNFDATLPITLDRVDTVDLVFIDGNHRYAPTLDYFAQIMEKTNNDSILIFDDIHWSKEMEKAWNVIKKHSRVKCTVDLFYIGIVFFRSEFREKQHFCIRF